MAAKPGAVISPVPPLKEGTVTWPGPGGPGRIAVPVAVASPVPPLNIPVPPVIVNVLENVGNPLAFGGPKMTESVPVNVSAPPLKDAIKLFITEAGINAQ